MALCLGKIGHSLLMIRPGHSLQDGVLEASGRDDSELLQGPFQQGVKNQLQEARPWHRVENLRGIKWLI